MMEFFKQAMEMSKSLSVPGLLVVILVGLLKPGRKLVVVGWLYDEVCRDRDEWRRIALEAHGIARSAVQGFDDALAAMPAAKEQK